MDKGLDFLVCHLWAQPIFIIQCQHKSPQNVDVFELFFSLFWTLPAEEVDRRWQEQRWKRSNDPKPKLICVTPLLNENHCFSIAFHWFQAQLLYKKVRIRDRLTNVYANDMLAHLFWASFFWYYYLIKSNWILSDK